MANDVDTRSRNHAQSAGENHHGEHGDVALDPSWKSPRTRWWMRGLLLIAAVVILASSFAILPGISADGQTDRLLTHTIRRGDLLVTVTEQGTLESAENTEIICKVRGQNTVNWVIESGSIVEPGDELIRLDTLYIDEQISERTKYAHWSKSGADSWKANMERAQLAIPEYLEGRYVAQLMTLEKDLAIAESNLRAAQNILGHAKMMAERGYVSELEVDQKDFTVTQAALEVEVKETEIDVLKRFSKAEELERLKGELNVAIAQFQASDERAEADASRRDRALDELTYCVMRAERGGMVIHPSAARWKNAPEIIKGGTVYKDQVLLLMPDLSKMQVKIGVHESIIDRVTTGLTARVTLPDRSLEGEVTSVASITSPAGWWTGNVVKYDTVVSLPSVEGLKPGMSAEVEVIMAQYENVLKIPVAAVVATEAGDFCWVKTAEGVKRRPLRLGDTNDVFLIVEQGLREGEEVVLNPLAFVEEAQDDALKPLDKAQSPESTAADSEIPAADSGLGRDRGGLQNAGTKESKAAP